MQTEWMIDYAMPHAVLGRSLYYRRQYAESEAERRRHRVGLLLCLVRAYRVCYSDVFGNRGFLSPWSSQHQFFAAVFGLAFVILAIVLR